MRENTCVSGKSSSSAHRRRIIRGLAGFGVCLLIISGTATFGQTPEAGEEGSPRILLLADDLWGANWNIEDEKPNIKEFFLSYGWELDLASVKAELAPCAFARKATGVESLKMDRLVSEVSSVKDYDAVVILPGQSHRNLINDPETLALLREAAREGIVLAGFCRGVRLLSQAGVVRNRRITGHPDYAQEYINAGAEFIGFKDIEEKSDAPPPVVDGNLITTVRSKYYREQVCEAIRTAVENARKKRRGSNAFGCTIVMASQNGLVLAGNNEDRNHPETIVNFIPATEKYYGRIVFGYDDSPVQGGMNDRGLFVDGNALAPTGWRPDPDKPTFRGNTMMVILGTCATCEDVKVFFEKSNHPSLERARFPVADRSGASMVVEYGRDGMQFVTSEKWYQIATNFVMSNVEGDDYPCRRYRTADKILSQVGKLSLDLVRRTLDATHQEGRALTVYSNIYNLKKGLIHVYNLRNFDEVVVMDLAEELKKGPRRIELPSLFNSPGPSL